MAKDKDKDPEAEDRDEADDRDEDEAEARDESDDESDDDESDESDDEPKAAKGDDESDDDDDESDDDDDEERHASTEGVAKALGVDVDEDAEAAGKDAPAAAPNRAARRRDDAVRKRRARTDKTPEDDSDDAVSAKEPLPKDKNLRAKELLKRRQEAAASRQSSTAVGLSAGEMVQDSLARAGSGATKFLRQHGKKLGVALVAGVVGTAGILYFLEQRDAKAGVVTDSLNKAVLAEMAPVVPDDKRPDDVKALDPMPVFPSSSAKTDAVLAAYTKVIDDHPGTGPAILAKLGQAGTYLEKSMPDQAFTAYEDVLRSDLAKADVDVRARAIEGKAFALEAKKDFDGAMTLYKELEGVDKAYAELAKYHQARMLVAKGEKDQAKELFLALKKTLEVPTLEGPQAPHLRALIDENLQSLDPSIPRPKRAAGGPKEKMSPEEIEELKRKIEEMQKQQGEGHGDDAH